MSYTLLSPSFLYTLSNSYATCLANELHLGYDSVLIDLPEQRKNYNSSFSPSVPTSLLPLAVRYISPDKTLYLIERPPFESPIDFSTAKSFQRRRPPAVLKDKTMWIPWTVALIKVNSTYPFYEFYLYFNDRPLTSIQDQLVPCFLPNSGNGHICLGNDLHPIITARQNDTEVPVTEIYNLFFNSYFAGWNSDIHNTLPNLSFLKSKTKFIERITQTNSSRELKVLQRDNIQYDYTSSLLALSYLTLEEMLQYIGSIKELYSAGNSRFHSLNHISLFSSAYHEHSVTGSTVAHCDIKNFHNYFPIFYLLQYYYGFHYILILFSPNIYSDNNYNNYILIYYMV